MTEMTGANRRAFLLMQGQKALRSLPRAIYELGSIFADAGHELALVGGPVRDAFLGLPIHDFDFTTSARPGETQELLDSWGSTTWDVGREFGTIGSVRRDLTVEVTTYRTDSYDVGSRKPGVGEHVGGQGGAPGAQDAFARAGEDPVTGCGGDGAVGVREGNLGGGLLAHEGEFNLALP